MAKARTLSESVHSGFGASLGKRIQWRFAPDNPIAEPFGNPTNRDTDMCGGCHSLRTPLVTDPVGKPYHQAYRLELPDDIRYFPDGQIREEVFVLGSFLQSKMHVRGVRCGDCHEPHSGDLRLPKATTSAPNATAPIPTTSRAIIGTLRGKPGSACVDCHMPARTYMGVDDRRDHSFPVPRPDLSLRNSAFQTPAWTATRDGTTNGPSSRYGAGAWCRRRTGVLYTSVCDGGTPAHCRR